MPQSSPSGNMPLMSVPLPLSLGPFSPSETQPLLSLPLSLLLLLPFMSVNVHFISALFDGFKTVITNPVSPKVVK